MKTYQSIVLKMFGENFGEKAYEYIEKRFSLVEWENECWKITMMPDWKYEKSLNFYRNL